MSKKLIFIFIIFNWLFAQVSVNASVDVNRIAQSETLGFKIVANNVDGTPSVDISPVQKDFKIVSGPAQQTNIQWVNGAMTSSRTLSWTLLAKKVGNLNIPGLNVRVGNETYRTNPIGISVEKGAGRAQLANLFIEAKPDKEIAYPGEQITVTYRLFTRLNLSIEDIEYPKSIGFWIEDLRVAQTVRFRDTQINGVNYKVATLYKAAMFPTQTGELVIAPMTAICNVEKSSPRRGSGVFNDPFFNSMFKETQRQFIQSDSLTIMVTPYPDMPPPDFTGAVGEFKVISSVDTSIVDVNEAVTFRIKLNGKGNLNQFNMNAINFPQNMEVFPPTSSYKRDELRDEITGELSIEYILIPRIPGEFTISPVAITYFNPSVSQFLTARSPSVNIEVKPDNNPNISFTGFSKENVDLIGEDILYIRTEIPNWTKKGGQSIPIWVWGTYLVAVGLFSFPSLTSKYKSKRKSTAGARKAKGALKVALNSLELSVNDPFAHTSEVMYRYFQSKLFLASEQLDPRILESALLNKISNPLILKVVSIAKICDAGRFGPDASLAKDTIQKQAGDVLREIELELI